MLLVFSVITSYQVENKMFFLFPGNVKRIILNSREIINNYCNHLGMSIDYLLVIHNFSFLFDFNF